MFLPYVLLIMRGCIATLRLTVAALIIGIACDSLLWCWLSVPLQSIRFPAPLLLIEMVFDRGWAQNWAQ
jgi:hypothetical protein